MESLLLSTTAYILLGMLTFRPRSGYELKALVDRSIRYFTGVPTRVKSTPNVL